MRFTKMQGAGNDYVYVDCFAQPMPADPPALARKIADRHFGVGGDGLILICRSETADARMRMYNADGSEAEMCGNGVRCVAKYVHDHGIAGKPQLKIETGRGILTLDLEIVAGLAERVRVDMGEPILEAEQIPVELPRSGQSRIVDLPLKNCISLSVPAAWMEDCGLDMRMTAVSMGNPHLILYCRDVSRAGSTCISCKSTRAAKQRCGPGSAAAGSRWPAARGRVPCVSPARSATEPTASCSPISPAEICSWSGALPTTMCI
jgi:diaminopimelate epimerase